MHFQHLFHNGPEVEQQTESASTNPQTGDFYEKSIFEAEGGLQGELEGLYSNLERTKNPEVDLDFEAIRRHRQVT